MRLTEKIKMIPIRELIETQEEYEKQLQISKEHNKLVDLESIEEELGIDLITLFNILRTGGHIWVKNCKGINYWHVESLKQRGLDKQWYLTYSNNVRVKLKDYGITWALTKEELENDNHN